MNFSQNDAVWSDKDDVTCPICMETFGSDPSVTDKSMLPVRSNCDHCICHECLQQRYATLVVENKPKLRYVSCPVCSRAKSFDAKHPEVCRKTCRIVSHYKTETKKRKPMFVKQEENDQPVLVLLDSDEEGEEDGGRKEEGKEEEKESENETKEHDGLDQKMPARKRTREATDNSYTFSESDLRGRKQIAVLETNDNIQNNTMTGQQRTTKRAKKTNANNARSRRQSTRNDRNVASVERSRQQPDKKIVTLLDLLKEKGMKASLHKKHASPKRELLRFYSKGLKVIKPRNPWKWDANDPDLDKVRLILDKYKQGLRAPPSKKWRKAKNVNWSKRKYELYM